MYNDYAMKHAFHIPVLGLAFSIDSPIKVAKYGISSVLSIVDDELIERVRQYYAQANGLPFIAIDKGAIDARAHRITAYLNLVQELVDNQIKRIKEETFAIGSDLNKYFELLSDKSKLKSLYNKMLKVTDKGLQAALQEELRQAITPGSIDVNIMSKVDKLNLNKDGEVLPEVFSDALAALRGFATSTLSSAMVLSAGMNPRLYNYLAAFDCFYPDQDGLLQKKIVLKVSDYRSAYIQAKYLAKKGIWVSEFRVESGLNCGGHAFATEGLLLGPVLEEFKQKKQDLLQELLPIYQHALAEKGVDSAIAPSIRFTVQGGIGTADEQDFLCTYYDFDGTGWGSPFLLVPEATTVDPETLQALVAAKKEDFYLSGASPLGVPFNNFSGASAEKKRLERIEKGRPGSPCNKKYLVSSSEFGKEPLCTASRVYQHYKIKELESLDLAPVERESRYQQIVEKTCLCQGLASSAYINYGLQKKKEDLAVSICPGPNLAYFDQTYSLKEMVDHIYGRKQILLKPDRENMFINELAIYIDYLKKHIASSSPDLKNLKYIAKFKSELHKGIQYYADLAAKFSLNNSLNRLNFLEGLKYQEQRLALIN